MVEINLLPWRQSILQKQKRQARWFFLVWLGLILLILSISHGVLAIWLVRAKQNLESLELQLSQLSSDVQVVKDLSQQFQQLQALNQQIQRMEGNRAIVLKLFHHFLLLTPVDVTFSQIIRKQNQIIFIGSSRTIAALRQLMKSFSWDSDLNQPELIEIKQQSSGSLKFQFQVLQHDTTIQTS
ncbi:MAG: PilN domain-containing protein [Gammaproteobacteria bacterium]